MQLGWREAAERVLTDAQEDSMHYADIAEAIAAKHLRTDFGATPATAVNVAITQSINNDGSGSPFVRVARGIYGLRARQSAATSQATQAPPVAETTETGLINAFGMYWSRDNVLWSTVPRILGQQQPESTAVDFCQQRGVYLLHDGRSVVYVGRTTDQAMGVRLRQHITDRLNGRWDRFSWFGTYSVNEAGALDAPKSSQLTHDVLIATMEALLIEGLEPPQNRKRGDDFRAVEYLQVKDPDIKKKSILALMDELKTKL